METVQMVPSMLVVALMERWGDRGLAMVMYLSTAMADMVSTAATMLMCVIKLVTRQKYAPNTQSLEENNIL